VVVDVASLLEDLEASIINIARPSIMEKDEPIAKWLRPLPLTQPHSVLSSNVSTFETLAQTERYGPHPTTNLKMVYFLKIHSQRLII
jgi:hypothetical protein